MLSIFIMYSTDREVALDATLSCLREMEFYDVCQKTIVVDGRIDRLREGWEYVQVPRVADKFCWGRMWDAGVCTAQYEKVLYLDSDRLLPADFLKRVLAAVEDDVFVFTSSHFQMLKEMSIEDCKLFLKSMNEEGVFLDEKFMGSLRFEARYGDPIHRPGKNVMSGSTAFTKSTYLRLGGVDHSYCGHGAYADTDFHYAAAVGGCQFVDLQVPELHWPHKKRDGNKALSDVELWQKSLDNFVLYCLKWDLPLIIAENLAYESAIRNPRAYIKKRVEELRQSPRNL